MSRLALVLALAAGAAAAQDGLDFSPAATEACLAAATRDAGREACVGASAQACMGGDFGSSTAGMTSCLGAEGDYWDARLNAAYGALIKKEEAADREATGTAAGGPSTAEALRTMERAWIAWRDAACAYEASLWRGGTGSGPAGVQCWMTMTGAQALRLEARLHATEP